MRSPHPPGAADASGRQVWVRRRPRSLAWTLLAGMALVLGQGVWRYTSGGVELADDLFGLVFRVAVVALLVGVFLRAGGTTIAAPQHLVVHDGVRRFEFTLAQITRIDQHGGREGAVAVLRDGRRIELPGVPSDQARDVWRRLRRR